MDRLREALSLADRRIGVSMPVRILLAAVALAVCWIDMATFTDFERASSLQRLALGGVPYTLILTGVPSLRSNAWAPLPSRGYWLRVIGSLLLLSLLLAAPFFLFLKATEPGLPPSTVRLMGIGEYTKHAMVQAPLMEEAVYRGAICLSLWVALGPWLAVILSGAAFTYLHVLYGNFAPNHIVAGVILSWAFIKSGQLWMAIGLHAAGNLLAGVMDLLFLE